MPSNTTKILLACIVACVVFGLIFLQRSSTSSSAGGLQESEPRIDINKVLPIKSNENLALTKFAGSIIYEPDHNPTGENKHIFMPLVANSQLVDFSVVKRNGETQTNKLSLNFEFASIVIELDETASTLSTKAFRLDLVKPIGGISQCYFDADINYYHYRCNQERFRCLAMEKTSSGAEKTTLVAVLDAKVFEFEIGGDPEMIRNGKFSKPVHDCRDRKLFYVNANRAY